MLTITATDLPRFMACNGSVNMPASNPAVETDNTVKNEGLAAHWVVEQVVNHGFTPEELIDRKSPEGVFITAEMIDAIDDYLAAAMPGLIEHDTSFNGQTWAIRGRADSIFYDCETCVLTVNDFKYGWSIVEPYMNWTLLAHVFGFMAQNAGNSSVTSARLRIFQPRPYHHGGPVREWLIDLSQIQSLYNIMVDKLNNPENMLHTGAHCHYCPAMATCPAARKAQYNAIEASETTFSDNIDNGQLSAQLDHVKRASAILEDIKKAYTELALHRIKQGEIVPNYSLDQSLSNRQWQGHITPEFLSAVTGKDLTKKQLVTPAQAEKMGIKKEVVNVFDERIKTGVKLVRMDAHEKAQKLFNQPKGK